MQSVSLPKYQPVIVSWRDSAYKAGWQLAQAPEPPELIEAIGYVIETEGDNLVITQALGEDCHRMLNALVIPWVAVESIEGVL